MVLHVTKADAPLGVEATTHRAKQQLMMTGDMVHVINDDEGGGGGGGGAARFTGMGCETSVGGVILASSGRTRDD